MDFNEIKNTWKSSIDKIEPLTNEQFEAIPKIKSKSNTALGKIKSSFRFELITGLWMYLFIITGVFVLIPTPQSIIFFVIVSMLMGIPMIFYYKTYKKVQHVIYTENTFKQSLQMTINDIEKFVMLGKNNYLKFIMIPMSVLTGMFMGLYIGSGESNIIEIFNSLETRSIIKMITLLVIFTGIMIPFAKYWFKKKFKQHYLELKNCMKELEEETIK